MLRNSRQIKSALDPADRRRFRALQLIRALIAVGASIFIAQTVDLGSPLALLITSAIVGIYFAGTLLKRGARFPRVVLWHLALGLLLYGGLSLTNLAFTADSTKASINDFYIYRLAEHIRLVIIFYLAGFLSTWAFWFFRSTLTIEVISFSLLFTWLLSGHRNYNLDSPKNISGLAWEYPIFQIFDLGPQHILLALGLLFVVAVGLYLFLGTTRPLFGSQQPVKNFEPVQAGVAVTIPLLLLTLLGVYAYSVNQFYSVDLSRTTNGVGMEGEEGESPLGFHSAIGQTKQPAALVRLEGDYNENPWTPMLYMREGALSNFDGHELVVANRNFDSDVPRIQPGQPYISFETDLPDGRKKVTQSIYLLKEHAAPFAVDYPRSIRLIKNPDEDRFELAYQALSFAPTIRPDQLIGENVGDPKWDQATWAHYLRAPGSQSLSAALDFQVGQEPVLDEFGEDLRYLALSKELTTVADAPVLKAAYISDYLSKESIYTRAPGHELTQKGDPVAPYLFSDEKRGYCVHFAHAAVYLMRLSGIPARIATGYLTDLSYAKDGHILLHLGDRHAWPEVYVEGQGWVVLDVTPERAENEEAIIPDEKLLEELMSKIDPAEELLDPILPEELGIDETTSMLTNLLKKKILGPTFVTLLIAWLLLKLWLRFGYTVAPAGVAKVRLGYISFAATMADIGISRRWGETRQEYSKRLRSDLNINASRITELNELRTYRGNSNGQIGTDQVAGALQEFRETFDKSKKKWRRYVGIVSPLSVGKWYRW